MCIRDRNNLIDKLPTSTAKDVRNKAIIELLYSSGLRVSELINLKINDVKIDVPERIYEISKPLKEWMEEAIESLAKMGLHSFPNGNVTAKTLEQARKRVQISISRGVKSAYRASSIVADCQRAVNLISALESQGIGAAREYLERSKGLSKIYAYKEY